MTTIGLNMRMASNAEEGDGEGEGKVLLAEPIKHSYYVVPLELKWMTCFVLT